MNAPLQNVQHTLLVPVIAFSLIVIGGVTLLPAVSSCPVDCLDSGTDGCGTRGGGDVRALAEDFPSSWKVMLSDPRNKGWLQIGMIPADIREARDEVSELMSGRGFRCRHVVGVEDDNGRVLLQYEGNGQKVLWSLWAQGRNRTGFSWGISK